MQQQYRHSRRIRVETENSTLWAYAHFLIMINEPAELSREYRVLDVNSLSKKISSDPGVRNGHLRLVTRCMRKIPF